MKKTNVLGLTVLLSMTAVSLCGCPPPPPRPTVGYVPSSLEGVYNGNHEVHFQITSPSPQNMEPSVNQGPVHVYEETDQVRLSLRLYDTGEPCHLVGHRQAGTGRVVIDPGQRCSIRMLYQGTYVIAGLQIDQGVADFESYGLRTSMTGPFVAEALVGGRRQSMALR
jgi:hypothetical protein